MKLTVHIIVFDKDNMTGRQNVFIALEGINRIRRFRSMLSGKNNERAMMFALSNGNVIDQDQVNSSTHVILTRDGTYWDLM